MKAYGSKDHFVILSLLILPLCFLGYVAVSVSEQKLFSFHSFFESVEPALHAFQMHHQPRLEINFTELYGSQGQFQVLHPLLDVRKLKFHEITPTCNPENAMSSIEVPAVFKILHEEDGLQPPPDNYSGRKLSKLEAYRKILRGMKLPEEFLLTPPFVSDWGNSFAYLLVKNGLAPYSTKNWIEKHLSFFKVSELAELFIEYQIQDPQYSVIAKFNDAEIEELVRASPLVITKDYLLLKNQSRLGFSPLSYWVYDLSAIQTELKEGKYELTAFTAGALCLQKMGNGCWAYNSRHTMAYLYRYSLAILVLFGLVVLTFLGFYFKRLYEKNKAQQKHRLALQVLSHEFRTPVSALLLMLEKLTSNSSRFSLADQDLITRSSTEIFRLQRIIEVSKTYLQTESHRVHFKYVEIPSINNWICDFAHETNQNVQFQLLPIDQSVETDPFWLKFILSNLVENAFNHGQPPVYIRLARNNNQIKITVEDQGECEFTSLQEMTGAFAKSQHSQGMGLGLNITKFILDDWGTKILFSKSPTAFTLLLNEKR